MASIWPTTGPIAGSTTVTLYGTTFINSDMLYCKFGTQRSVAKFIAISRAECLSPSVAAAGSVSLTLSNNNQDFSGARTFIYQNDIVLSSLSNSYGPQGMSLVLFRLRC